MRASWGLPVAVGLLAAVVTASCDKLLTDPAPALPEVIVSFNVDGATLGGAAQAFDKVNRAYLLFVRPDSAQRDTLVRVTHVNGAARVRLILKSKERVHALGVYAQLRRGEAPLFQGSKVIRIEVGKPTSAQIPILPVPFRLRADRHALTLPAVGDTAHLSSAVLFATGDTIHGLAGTWSSDNADIVFVTQAGLAVGRNQGQTVLRARYGELSDSVVARVLGGR
jgi:hypothetical protein